MVFFLSSKALFFFFQCADTHDWNQIWTSTLNKRSFENVVTEFWRKQCFDIDTCTDLNLHVCARMHICKYEYVWVVLLRVLSLSFSVSLTGKPRNISSRHLEVVNLSTKPVELTFEVIANPIPRDWGVWLTQSTMNSSEAANVNIKPMTNFTCKVDVQTRYLSRCVLTIFIIPSDISAGSLKVQIINEVGDENFTVEIRHGEHLKNLTTKIYIYKGYEGMRSYKLSQEC